jgi:lipid-binding SYLF domain-containing protein
MKKLLLLSLAVLLGPVVARAAESSGAKPPREELMVRIESCRAILHEFQAMIPAEVWRNAKGVIILNQFKAGFLFGIKDGYGVIMVKKTDGSGRWSLPVLINAGEASFGLQVGANRSETIFIINDEKIPRLLFNHRFNIGVDAKAVAGPKAAERERFSAEILKSPLLAYSKSTGLFVGATVKAGHISRNDWANHVLYNTQYAMPELLYSDWVTPPKVVEPLMALVTRLAP